MSGAVLQRFRGHEVLVAAGGSALLGLLLSAVPQLDRVSLLLASAGLLAAVGALGIWLVRDHHTFEWTTSAGTVPRPRGSDRRVTALARAIDASLTHEGGRGRDGGGGSGGAGAADPDADADSGGPAGVVHSTLRSLAEARLPQGVSLDDPDGRAEQILGRDLTAYLVSSRPRHLRADELYAFITTLEEHE